MSAGWESLLTLVALIAVTYVVSVWIGLVVWTYRDVKQRTADGNERLAAVGLVALFFAPGWLVYLLLRPADTLDDVRIEQLQAQLFSRELATTASCTRCRRRVEDEFLVCPFCRESLRVPCATCARPISTLWAACAYCGDARPRLEAVSATSERRPAEPRRAAAPPTLVPREAR
jgi:hypothetical protein